MVCRVAGGLVFGHARGMEFEASGAGDRSLVCIHGWGCEGGQFAPLAGCFERDFRVYRLDLPGHGRTPLGDFRPGFASYAAAVADFVTGQGLERPVLLGHSMGGVAALMAAASGKFRPGAVINLDGGLPPAPRTRAGQEVIRAWLAEPDFRQRLAVALREGFFLPGERDTRCAAIVRGMCAAPEAVLRFLPNEMGLLDAGAVLPRIDAPVLFAGSAFPRFDEASPLLSGVRLRRIAGAGHFLHVYALGATVALIQDFLKEMPS